MKKSLNQLSEEELGKLFPIKVVKNKRDWKTLYKKERKRLLKILGKKIILRTEHIGSTAINNIATKQTVDILIKIPEVQDRSLIIEKMKDQGYNHMENHPTHLMFVKGYTPSGVEKISYHIHMGAEDEDHLWERIYFRDYLNDHPNVATKYEKLKLDLAKKHKYNRELYTKGKTTFIKEITQKAKSIYK